MIYILDELTVRPGQLAAVKARVRADYMPGVEARGMTLVDSWIAPAVELHDEPTQLLLLWSIPDEATFWKVKSGTAHDPTALQFWDDLSADLEGRSRRIMAPTSIA